MQRLIVLFEIKLHGKRHVWQTLAFSKQDGTTRLVKNKNEDANSLQGLAVSYLLHVVNIILYVTLISAKWKDQDWLTISALQYPTGN